MMRFVLSAAIFVFGSGALFAEPLSLNACYDLALKQSEQVSILDAEWRAAEARYRRASDSWMPDVSLASAHRFEPEVDDVSSSGNRHEVLLTASQPIFTGFRLTREAEAAKAETRAAWLTSARFKEVLYQDVSDVFYQTLLNQEDIKVLDALAAALEQRVAELDRRVKLGRSRKGDLLGAQTDLEDVKVIREATAGRLAASRELLSFLTGQAAESLVVADASAWTRAPDLDTALTNATARKDIQAAEAGVEGAERRLAAEKGSRWPEIRAGADYTLYEDPDNDSTWGALLTLELPIFDDNVIKSRIEESREALNISRLNLARLRRESASDVRLAFSDFSSSLAQWQSLGRALQVAEENYALQQDDYALGRASNLDVLSALAQVQNFRRRAVLAEMQARASLVRLHVAAGEVAP